MSTPPTQLGEPRNAFMQRVRVALERTGPAAPPAEPAPVVDDHVARLVAPDADLVSIFAERAVAVGMQVHRTAAATAADEVAGALRSLEAKRIGIAAGGVGARLDLAGHLASAGFTVVEWRDQPNPDSQFDLDAGITDVAAAFAETGTLVCTSGPDTSRGLSLIPPAHVAIVRRSDILPDMLDYHARLRGIPGSDLPSSISFITGPSKTSDIEGLLVTGVHGPGHVHIVLVEDL